MGLTDFSYPPISQWRLRTPGGIRYKFVEMSGNFTENSGSVSCTFLIQSSDLVEFVGEMFPRPVELGSTVVPRTGPSLPGVPNFFPKNINFKSHLDGLPIDPFGFDDDADERTYAPVLAVDVEFSPLDRQQQPNEDDPTTFLEISCTAGGEYIHGGGGGDVQSDPGESPSSSTTKRNRKPQSPVIITVPNLEWSVKWNYVPYTYYKNTFHARLMACLGCVNSAIVPWLFNAAPETLLFGGWSYRQYYTWDEGEVNAPPVEVDMKFIQKSAFYQGNVIGYNHFWVQGEGWKRLKPNENQPYYTSVNMNALFTV